MAHLQVADGGNGLQIWRATANILNKQSRRADKRWPTNLGLGVGLKTAHRKNLLCYEMFQGSSDHVVNILEYILEIILNMSYAWQNTMMRHVKGVRRDKR
jgi:hypothetical protein